MEYSKSSSGRRKPEHMRSQLSSSKLNPNVQRVKHIKCKVIKLVKEQIERIDTNMSQELKDCLNNSMSHYLWRKRYYILSLMVLFVLVWLVLVYGAMLGAALCGARVRSSGCANCHGTNFMQSVKWTKNAVSIFWHSRLLYFTSFYSPYFCWFYKYLKDMLVCFFLVLFVNVEMKLNVFLHFL